MSDGGLLRLRHWQSDALTIRLNLIHNKYIIHAHNNEKGDLNRHKMFEILTAEVEGSLQILEAAFEVNYL